MRSKLAAHLRSNAIAYVALVVALSGSAYAVNGPLAGRNTVGSGDIINDDVTGKDVAEGSLYLAAGPWHLVGAASEPAFNTAANCTWANYLNGWAPASFVRDRMGFVHLRGRIFVSDSEGDCQFNNYLGRIIFTLPAGFRPAADETHPITSNDLPGFVYVLTDGQIRLEGPTTEENANQWVAIHGITFRCGPSGANGCP